MNTPPRFDQPWERRLHEELHKLPEMEAPASLVPGVMAAIRARQAAAAAPAWYRRPATTWPPALRIALAVSALALFGLLVLGAQLLWPQVVASADTGALAAAGQKVITAWSIASTLADAFLLVVREALSSPWVVAILAAVCFSYLALLGAGTALWRTVLNPQRP
jgi:hypothetical protein